MLHYIFRFGKIVFTLARTFAVHREKSVVSGFLRSVLITYLMTSSLEKEIIVLGKSVEKVLNFGLKICTNPERLMERKPDPLTCSTFPKVLQRCLFCPNDDCRRRSSGS